MIDITDLTPEERMVRAKIQMYQKSPFFSYILLHMKMTLDKDNRYLPPDNQTMGVDANGNLYWSEKFVKECTERELMGVVAHEVLHVALLHMERGEGKDREIFNIANDLVVNDVLQCDDFILPKCGMLPDKQSHTFEIFGTTIEKINEKSSEEIYDELYRLAPEIKYCLYMMGGSGDGQGSEDGDKPKKPKGMSGDDVEDGKGKLKQIDNHIYGKFDDGSEEVEGQDTGRMKIDRSQKWKKIVAEAAQLAKQQGKLPAGLERRIEGILDSKMNWKQRLYKYVVAQLPYDYSWNKPNKRGAGLGIYLPETVKESVHIVVSIDTSGSVGGEELREFLSELVAIGTAFINIKMDIIICDAEVHETYQLTRDNVEDIMAMPISGGGGTDHVPIYDYVRENIHDCKVLINFTDGFTSFPSDPENLAFESLWVINKHGCDESHIPFGEYIKLV